LGKTNNKQLMKTALIIGELAGNALLEAAHENAIKTPDNFEPPK
jgi:hypothetical protein